MTPPATLGPFTIRAVLGVGGSSCVYDVTEASRGAARLALKVLKDDQPLSDGERQRFLDEAARMRRVEHAALVPLVDAGQLPDGRPYLLMPRIAGETLARRLSRGPLPVADAIRHICTLADALASIHAAGMVHRDIKPENIVLEDDPILLDFGIARDIDAESSTTTAQGHVRGTPAYMAPERFFGAPASVRSDVYELGVVFYMMLTGRLPWSAEAYAAERLNPRSPEELGVSRDLSVACLRALSTRPEMRPDSACAFADAVVAAAAATSGDARATADLPMIVGGAGDGAHGAYGGGEEEGKDSAAAELSPRDTTRVRPSRLAWGIAALLAVGVATAGLIKMRASAGPAAPVGLGGSSAPVSVTVPSSVPVTESARAVASVASSAPFSSGPTQPLKVSAAPATPARDRIPASGDGRAVHAVPVASNGAPSGSARVAPPATSRSDGFLEDRR